MCLKAIALFLLAPIFYTLAVNAGEIDAIEFAKALEDSGPSLHGVPLRKTEIIDIDQNGSDEILLTTNRIEEGSPGFLNEQLYEALAWVDIYSKTNSGYKLSTQDFKEFLRSRAQFYQTWLERIRTFDDLSVDSVLLIRENYRLFQTTLMKYLELASQNGS